MQEEIFRHPEHFRTWQDQGRLPEVQGEKGQTGHLALYDQDQPEKLIAALEFPGRSDVTTSSGAGPSSMRLRFRGALLRFPDQAESWVFFPAFTVDSMTTQRSKSPVDTDFQGLICGL
jgi:hypothetical protein